MINEIIESTNTDYWVKEPNIYFCFENEENVVEHSVGNSGLDVKCAKDTPIVKNGTTLIPTGMKSSLPLSYELLVRPRSGLAVKMGKGFCICNSPGTIDSDYRGEIKIITEIDKERWFEVFGKDWIPKGMKIAQLVLNKIVVPYELHFLGSLKFKISVNKDEYKNFDDIYSSARGSDGFGSTGY